MAQEKSKRKAERKRKMLKRGCGGKGREGEDEKRREEGRKQNQIGVVLVDSGYGGLQKLDAQLLVVRVWVEESTREKRDHLSPTLDK